MSTKEYEDSPASGGMSRRNLLLAGTTLAAVSAIQSAVPIRKAAAQAAKPNILVIWGDDIGTWNISHRNLGMMGYRTPNIDRIANEGLAFTDYYAQQSCTAGRAAFIGGNVPVRTGMTKVGLPGAPEGWQKTDVTMATVLKSQGYATGQFGKNHQGDRDEHLPTMHGFDEFFGNLYHLNAEEEPENRDYPKDLVMADGKKFVEVFGPRGVLHSWANADGTQKIENTGFLTKAHGDDRRRDRRGGEGIHHQTESVRHALVRVVEWHAHAFSYACQGGTYRHRRAERR
jgi:arylsulfatase